MKIKDLIKDFRTSFPELEEASRQEFYRWHREKPDEHVFFGYVLNPFLVEELRTMKNRELLERIFTFLESMATTGEKEVGWVLTATILEYLGDDKKILKKARSLMGSETLKLSHEVERGWGRE